MKLAGCLLKVALAIAVVGGVATLFLMARAGQFREIEPLAAGECRRYSGAPGAEDLEVDRATGTLLISSDDRRARAAGEPASAGLFTLDLRQEGASITELTHNFEQPLRPHGIHLVEGGGSGLLFVVNHGEGHSIEIFRYFAGTAVHLETVRDELLVSPNDVAGIDERHFYATNDHGPGGGMRRQFDDLLGLGRGSVVYWDGERMRTVAEGIGYANGIALNPENRYVYVASTTLGKILVYARDQENGDLDLIKELALDTGVDNLEIDLYGGIWVAGHPHLLSFMRHAGKREILSPSQVLWVDPAQDLDPWQRPIWTDSGAVLSGASVAVPFGARFAIGSVFEPDILLCDRS